MIILDALDSEKWREATKKEKQRVCVCIEQMIKLLRTIVCCNNLYYNLHATRQNIGRAMHSKWETERGMEKSDFTRTIALEHT